LKNLKTKKSRFENNQSGFLSKMVRSTSKNFLLTSNFIHSILMSSTFKIST